MGPSAGEGRGDPEVDADGAQAAGQEGPAGTDPPLSPTQEDFDAEQLSVLASCLQELFKAHFRGEVLPEELTEE